MTVLGRCLQKQSRSNRGGPHLRRTEEEGGGVPNGGSGCAVSHSHTSESKQKHNIENKRVRSSAFNQNEEFGHLD